MVVDKVWLISGQFRHISAKETCNMSIHGECFLSLLFRLVLFNYLGAHKRGDENPWSPRKFWRKSLSHSSSWISGHYATQFAVCAPSFHKVYIHQLLIHFEDFLLITWHRNKHHLSVPDMITKHSENWFESSFESSKRNLIVESFLNRTVQNVGVKISIKTKEMQKAIFIID